MLFDRRWPGRTKTKRTNEMTAKKDFWISKRSDGKWAVKKEGATAHTVNCRGLAH